MSANSSCGTCVMESMQGKGDSVQENKNGNKELSHDYNHHKRHLAKWGFSNSRFISKSVDFSSTRSHRENLSVYSEPCQNTFTDEGGLLPKVFNTAMESASDQGSLKNETESELSTADCFKKSENTDPLVVFWEKSDKREQVETSVIVKFTLQAGEVFTHAFPKDSKVSDMKQVISEIFKIPVSMVQLEHNDCVLQDSVSISDLAIERFGTVGFQLSSLDPVHYPLILNNVYPDIPTNDVLTVIVQKGERIIKEVIVEVENRTITKPFLGGYRHRKTGLEYHHAFTQTAARPFKENVVSRITQTPGISKTTDVNVDKFTQTVASDIEDTRDNILYGNPKRYMQRQDELQKLLQDKVSLIQRNLRSWLVRKMMTKMKEEYKRCIEWEKNQIVKREEEKMKRQEKKEFSQKYPQSREDFESMYHNLKLWQQREAERIRSIDSAALRKAELCTLLEKEIKFINTIENSRIRFKSEALKKAQENFLEKTAAPLKWKGSKGHTLCMDTIGTQRARQLRELYQALLNTQVPTATRIKVLTSIKKAVQENENSLTPELTALLDRECQILIRDLKQVDLGILRERIQFLFLEYIKSPTVNPEAAKNLPKQVCRNLQMYKCISCQNVLPYFKFPLYSKANSFQKCTHCCWMQRIGGPRTDVNPIRHIMNAVRRDELRQKCYSSVALIMQEQDFYHLIINIWLGHSAIGGSGNLEELHMGRWNFKEDWSPWNCILLTREELRAHLRFSNPEQIYSPLFVKKIKQRHQMGKIHFSELVSHSVKHTSENVDIDSLVRNYRAATTKLVDFNKAV